jgi:hypothetical protein
MKKGDRHLFSSAPDRAEEQHAVVFDSVYNDNRYLLIFTPGGEGRLHDLKLDKLSEVIYRLGDKEEAIYLLPRNRRGTPVAAEHRKLLTQVTAVERACHDDRQDDEEVDAKH